MIEALESRILLASFPYNNHLLTLEDKAALLQGLNVLPEWLDRLASTGELARQMPGVKTSLGDAVDLGDAAYFQLYEPVRDYFRDNPGVSTDDFVDKLKTLSATVGNLTFTVDPNVTGGIRGSGLNGDEIDFNMVVRVTRNLAPVVDLGPRWQALSLLSDPGGTVPLTATATLDFQFGYGEANWTYGPSQPFFKFNQISYAADTSATNLNFALDVGFLGATVQGGSVSLHATASAAVSDPNADAFGAISQSELFSALAFNTVLTAAGNASATLPLSASFGGYTAAGTPTISLSSNAIYAANPPDMVVNAAFQPLLNFSTLTAGSFNNLLGQLGGWMDMLRRSSQFGAAVPLVDNTRLNDLIDLQKAFNDRVVAPLTGAGSAPTYHNAQTFTAALAAALGVSEAAVAPHYDPATADLTFRISFSHALAPVAKPIDLSGAPAPLQILSNAGDATLTPSALLDFVVGARMNPLQATLTSGADAPANGRFTGAANFTLQVGQAAPVAVAVAGDPANNSIDDLVADFNAALGVAGLAGQLIAGRSGNRLTFTTRGAGVAPYIVLRAAPGNPILTAFGFTDRQTARALLDTRFFIRDADLGGSVTTALSNPLIGGRVGYLNFSSNTGSLTGTTTVHTLIKDPLTATVGGTAFLRDLINNVPDDVNVVALPPVLTGSATATLPLKVNPAAFGLGAGNPVATVSWTDIANPATLGVAFNADAQPLLDFSQTNSADVVAAIQAFATFLGTQQTTGVFGQKLPGLNRSIGQMLDLAGLTAQDAGLFAARPAGAVQFLGAGLAEAFGLPPGAVQVTFNNHLLRVNIAASTGATRSESVALDLAALAAMLPAGNPARAAIGGLQQLVASGAPGKVPVTINSTLNLNLGVDLTTPATPRPFIDNSSSLVVDLSVAGTGMNFKAGLGPLDLTVTGGSLTIGADANPATADAARFTVGLTPSPAGRRYLNELTPAAAAVAATGQARVALPLFFPTPADGLGTLQVAVTNLGNTAGTLSINAPNLAGQASSIDLANNLGTVLDGADAMFDTLQRALNTQIFDNQFPLIGRSLTSVDQFLGKELRDAVLAQLHARLDGGATPTLDLVRQALYAALGPAGLNVLAPVTSFGDFRDIAYTAVTDANNASSRIQFDLRLHRDPVLINEPINFDSGLPALSLRLDGNIVFRAGYDLDLSFGVDRAAGFYVDTSKANELTVDFNAGLPNVTLTGELGFLQATAADDPAKPSTFDGQFKVNLTGAHTDLSDPLLDKITYTDILNGLADVSVLEGSVAANANINLKLVAGFDNADLPTIRSDLNVTWGFLPGAPDLSGGLPKIAFNHVQLSLGQFYGHFAGPILGFMQDVLEPIKPVVDLLDKRLPLLSDLAGEDVTLVDLAQAFGDVEGAVEVVKAIGGVADVVTALPTGVSDDLYVDLGSFDLGAANVKTLKDLKNVKPFIHEVKNPLEGLAGQAKEFFDKSDSPGQSGVKISWPIIEHPETAFRLLLNQDVNLFNFDLPKVKLKFNPTVSFPIPVGVPLVVSFGGLVEVTGKLAFGFDTHGLQVYQRTRNVADIADGFYLSNRANADGTGATVPIVTFTGAMTGSLDVNFGVVSAGVGAKVGLTLSTYLNDPNNDGRVHGDELFADIDDGLACAIRITGEIFGEADIHAEVLGQDVDYTFAKVILYSIEVLPPECQGDRFESNNSLLAAADIGVGPGQHIQYVSIDRPGDADWYRVVLLKPDSLVLKATSEFSRGNVDIEITDAEGNILGQSATENNDEIITLKDLPAGSYYIHAYGQTNTYEFSVEPGPTSSTRVIYVSGVDEAAQGMTDAVFPDPAHFHRTNRSFYTLALGNDAYDGLTPDRPKSTLQSVYNALTLTPNDLIVLDTALYPNDVLAPALQAGVTIVGAPFFDETAGAVVRAANGWTFANSGNRIRNVRFGPPPDKGTPFPGALNTALTLTGDNNLAELNTFFNFSTYVSYGTAIGDAGDHNTIQDNSITGLNGIRLDAGSDHALVQRNFLTVRVYGVTVAGTHADVKSNTVDTLPIPSPDSPAFTIGVNVLGDFNTVESNGLTTADGIYISAGKSNTLIGNTILAPRDTLAITRGIWVRVDQPEADRNIVVGNDTSKYSYGLDMTGNGANVYGNRFHHNGLGGAIIRASNALVGPADPALQPPNEFDHNLRGLVVDAGAANATVRNDRFHDNIAVGIELNDATSTTFGNEVYANATGIAGLGVIGPAEWSRPNDIHHNSTGVSMAGAGGQVRFNRIRSNATGVDAAAGATVHHNLIYRNTAVGVHIDAVTNVSVINNTIYFTAGDGVLLDQAASNATLRNNIIWSDGGGYDVNVATDSQAGLDSDYNNLFASNGGKVFWFQKPFIDLYDWQVEGDLDLHSIGFIAPAPDLDNPRFRNLAGDDFHLTEGASTSIDAGDLASAFDLEPQSNGGRVNLGAFGNTAEAEKSPSAYLRVEYPDGYLDWEATRARNILWSTYNVAGSVRLELFLEGGGKVADIGAAPASAGTFLWSPQASGITPDRSRRYRIRITSVDQPSVTAAAREFFNVPQISANYYVNDGSTANDEFGAVPGDNRNNGRAPDQPKAAVLPILRNYALTANDVVRVDTGNYIDVRNLAINFNTTANPNPGSGLGDDQGFTIVGPVDPTRIASLDRANPAASAVHVDVNNANLMTLRRLTLLGGGAGVLVRNNSAGFHADHLVIANTAGDGLRLDATAVNATLDALTVHDNAGNGIVVASSIPSLSNSSVYDNGGDGLQLTNAGGIVVQRNTVHHNNGYGIYVFNPTFGSTALIGSTDLPAGLGNIVHHNDRDGIFTASAVGATLGVIVAGNTVYDHKNLDQYAGIRIGSGDRAAFNVVYNNSRGIEGFNARSIDGNRVYDNTHAGIYAQNDVEVTGNSVYGNSVGVQTLLMRGIASGAPQLANNAIYNNAAVGLLIQTAVTTLPSGATPAGHLKVFNNTIYQTGGAAVRVEANSRDVELRNNIIQAPGATAIRVADDSQFHFTSESNILFAPGGVIGDWQRIQATTLLAWRNTAFTDYTSLSVDPRLVAPASGDLHERSAAGSFHGGSLAPALDAGTGLPVPNPGALTADADQSPAIDRGDDSIPLLVGTETGPNGNAVNLGAYGNTAQASRSPGQYVLVTSPQSAAVWPMGQTFPILWHTQDLAGSVAIELLHAGSASVVRAIAPAAANSGRFDWTLPTDLAPGNDYVVRVTRADAAGAGASDAFTLAPVTHTFYVNDGSVDAGSLTTAPGADANDGLTPATPKRSIQAVLDAYHLSAADTILVDRGVYALTANVTVAPDDAGVRIEGYHGPDPAGFSLLQRDNTTENAYVFEVLGASGVTLDHLAMTGARAGVFAAAGNATHLTVSNSQILDNHSYGINLSSDNHFASITGNKLSGDRSFIVEGVSVRAQRTGILLTANDTLISGNTLTQSAPILSDTAFGIAAGGLRNTVSGNDVSGYLYGISYTPPSTSSSNNPADLSTISGNTVHDNTKAGIVAAGSSNNLSVIPLLAIVGNTVYGQNVPPTDFTLTAGIYGGDIVSGNVVYDNINGIQGGARVSGNRVFGNAAAGILNAQLAQGNQVYSNDTGIVSAYRVENNLVYANATAGIEIRSGSAQNRTHVWNNTVYQPAGDAVRLTASSSGVDVRNNILVVAAGAALNIDATSQTGLSSDYNLIRNTGSAVVSKWGNQTFADLASHIVSLGFDAHSFNADPQFVNINGLDGQMGYQPAGKIDRGQDDNFHLAAASGSGEFLTPQSPAIDAGDPLTYFLSEPQPNGGRVNLGFDGNTAQATPSASPAIVVLAPHGGEQIQEGNPFDIQWTSLGLAGLAPVAFINVGGPTVAPYLVGNFQTLPTNQASLHAASFNYQTTNQPIDLSGVTDPAPMAVYQSAAWANSSIGNRITFSLPVPDGDYSIRLHFAELVSSNQAGVRIFDIKLQDQTVRAGYDIVADAGAALKATTQTFGVTAAAGRGILLDLVNAGPNPDLGPLISGIELVSINPAGAADAKFDLAVSVDNGATYTPIAFGVVADRFGGGSFNWTAGPQSNGTNALIKITSEDQPGVAGVSPQPFQIVPGGNNFYINDNTLTGDEYTAAPGNDANSGKSPAAPMATLSALLASYKPHAGDTIFVDTGTYNLLQNITLTADYAGVTIVGPTGAGHQAILNRGATTSSAYVFDVQTGANNITLDHLTITGAYVGVRVVTGPFGGSAVDRLSITNCTIFNNNQTGIDLPYGNTNALISGNTIYGDLSNFQTFQRTGIASAAPGATITGNTLYSLNTTNFQPDYGMTVSGDRSLVDGNTIHDTGRYGIYATNSVVVSNNTVYGMVMPFGGGIGINVGSGASAIGNTVYNSDDGISASGIKTLVAGNRVYHNKRQGIFTNGNPIVRGNAVYSNPIGITLNTFNGGGNFGEISGNLVYDNAATAIVVQSIVLDNVTHRARVTGNTIYQPAGDGIFVTSATNNADLRNNIIQVGAGSAVKVDFDSASGFSSDYNLFFTTGAGRIGTWAGVAVTGLDSWFYGLGLDGHSRVGDPRFVNPVGADGALGYSGGADRGLDDNFHVQADSPSIDLGDPSSPYFLEPGPNGGRVNAGADGNTAFAATSSAALVQVLSPVGREKFNLGQAVPIRWRSTGLTLQSPTLLVNAGGAEGSGWSADRYLTSGTAAIFAGAVDASGIIDPAPASVYGSYVRADNPPGSKLAYQFAVPDGSYTLRLHFFEPFNLNAGSRVFDINVQGATAVADYDIVGDAGTFAKATQQTITATASGGQGLSLELVNKTFNPALLAGVEILRDNPAGAAAPTFNVQLSTDNGATWSALADNVGVDHLGNGLLTWNAGPISSQDLVRVIANAAGSPQSTSPGTFLVANAGHDYYVNDASTAGDSLTTTVGNDANSGKSPDQPMASLLGLLAAYKPHAGDTVHVDDGTFLLLRNARLTADLSGVTIQGPAAGAGTATITRGGLPGFRQSQFGGINDFELAGAAGVTLDRLTLTGADVGVFGANLLNPFAVTSTGLTVSNSTIVNNAAAGVYLDNTNTFVTLRGNTLSGTPNGNANSTVQGVGIFAIGNDTQILDNTVLNTTFNGITLGGQRATTSGNTVANVGTGITDNSTSFNAAIINSIANNVVHDASVTGIRSGPYTLLSGNTVYNVAGIGQAAIQVAGRATNNTVYDSYDGIVSTGASAVIDHNRVFHNARAGITVSNNETVSGNRVYTNAIGVLVQGSASSRRFGGRIESNLVYDNASQGLYLGGANNFGRALVASNTIYQPVGDAIRLDGGSGNLDLRNNIIQVNAGYGLFVAANAQTGLVSDSNEFFKGPAPNAFVGFWNNADQPDFAAWRSASGQDASSLFADPRFLDINGANNIFAYDTAQNLDGGADDNFQLAPGSPAIDRGYSWGGPAVDLLGAARFDDPGAANAGSPNYAVSDAGAGLFDPAGGSPFTLFNSYNSFTLPFAFPLYGNSYTSVYVSVTGVLQFGGNDVPSDSDNSTAKLLNTPRVTALWDNLSSLTNVFIDSSVANQVRFRWSGTNNANNQPVNFAVVLFSDGRIRFDYGGGNTGLTPTAGISRGDGSTVLLAPTNGQATLTNANSVLFGFTPGFVDIGAYEFRGSSADTTLPVITASDPAGVNAGGLVPAPLNQITLTTSKPLNPTDANAPALYELRHAGANGALGDADDLLFALTPQYTLDSTTLTLALPAGARPAGLYRLSVFSDATRSLHDTSGLPLAGAGGNVAANYVRQFTLGAPANTPPAVALSNPAATPEGTAFSLAGSFTDPDAGQTFSATVNFGDGSAAVPLTLNPDRTFSLAHDYPQFGSFTLTVTLSDSAGGSTAVDAAVTITQVNPTAVFTNAGPFADGSDGSVAFASPFHPLASIVAAGFTYSYDFDNNGTFEITGSAAAATVPASFLTGVPSRVVRGRITDTRGGFTDYTTAITVTPPLPQPPTANDDLFSLKQNGRLKFSVLTNDAAGVGTSLDPASVVVGLAPQHGRLLFDAGIGEFVYKPDQNFTGEDSFTYTVSDLAGQVSNLATVTFQVLITQALSVVSSTVNSGSAQRSDVQTLAVNFSRDTNLPELIDNGAVVQAVQLWRVGIPQPTQVSLDASRFRFDSAINRLTLDLTLGGLGGADRRSILADGRYELRLVTDLIGSTLEMTDLIDTDGTIDGVHRIALHRLLGDFNGDAIVDLSDRPLLQQHLGGRIGTLKYDSAYDLNDDGVISLADYLLWTTQLNHQL